MESQLRQGCGQLALLCLLIKRDWMAYESFSSLLNEPLTKLFLVLDFLPNCSKLFLDTTRQPTRGLFDFQKF